MASSLRFIGLPYLSLGLSLADFDAAECCSVGLSMATLRTLSSLRDLCIGNAAVKILFLLEGNTPVHFPPETTFTHFRLVIFAVLG